MNTQYTSIKLCECGCNNPAPIAKRNNKELGHIAGQPVRFIRGHHNKVRVLRTVAERFWQKVNKRGPDECWPWTGSTDNHGYGALQMGTHDAPRPDKAPRVSYELHNGPIPEGMLVCHSCDVNYPLGDTSYRLCVNPAHLWLGTYTDNILDCYAKDRRNPPPGHGKDGEEHPSAHFTNEQVITWRDDFQTSGMTMTAFAALHSIPRNTMVSILKRVNYKHVV